MKHVLLLSALMLSLLSPTADAGDFKMAYKSKAELKKPADDYLKYVGSSDSLEDYAKMVVPTYVVTLKTFEQKVGSHGVLGRLAGAKSALTLTVKIDPKPLEAVMKEVVDESHVRFKKKLADFGYTIEDEVTAQKNEDVAEWFKDEIKTSPVVEDKQVMVGSRGVYDGLRGGNFTRDIESLTQIPHFVVSIGTFVDSDGPGVIKASHEGIDLFFKPEFKIQELKFLMNGKYVGSRVALKKPMASSLAISGQSEKTGDNSAERTGKAEAALQARKGLGLESNTKMFTYSEAGKSFEFNPNPAEFKKALMAELDKMEDLILEKYFDEID